MHNLQEKCVVNTICHLYILISYKYRKRNVEITKIYLNTFIFMEMERFFKSFPDLF